MKRHNTSPYLAFIWRSLSVAALSATMASSVLAQAWPNKPIKIIGAFPAGAAPDIQARALVQKLSEKLGQSVVIDNRPGANTIIGMQACASAAPDGYTFCITSSESFSVNPFLYKKLPYDAEKSFAPVAILGWPNSVIVASADLGVKTFKELVALAKSKPKSLNWSSFGMGSTSHLYLEWLRDQTSWDVAHVPFSPAQIANSLLSGQAQLSYFTIGGLKQHIEAGKMVPLLVMGDKRSPFLPNVPTFEEAGLPKFRVPSWFAMVAPAGTPPEAIKKMNEHVVAIINEPSFRNGVMTALTLTPSSETPEQMRAYMVKDALQGAELVRIAKVTLD